MTMASSLLPGNPKIIDLCICDSFLINLNPMDPRLTADRDNTFYQNPQYAMTFTIRIPS